MRAWQRAFTVEGLNLERLLRQAGEQGIILKGVRRRGARRMIAQVQERDLPALQELATRGGWQFSLGARKGAGALAERAGRRWLLLAALLLGTAVILFSTRIMWRVEVTGAGTYGPDIAAALEEWGIHAPMPKDRVRIGELRDALEWRYPRIAWFECGWRGMTLTIRAVEGILPMEDAPEDGPRDIVAARDGIVWSIVTRAGTPVAAVGDLVHAGQVLIKGEERTGDGLVRPVAARGTVTARVWEGASVRMSMRETDTAYTGREQTVRTVTSPWFDLWKLPESGFVHQDVSVRETPLGGFFLPLTLRTETRMEAEISSVLRDRTVLEAEASAAALRRLHEKVGPGESLVDIWGNCSIIEDEILLSVAIGEMRVDIGQQQPSSGMTAPEDGTSTPFT